MGKSDLKAVTGYMSGRLWGSQDHLGAGISKNRYGTFTQRVLIIPLDRAVSQDQLLRAVRDLGVNVYTAEDLKRQKAIRIEGCWFIAVRVPASDFGFDDPGVSDIWMNPEACNMLCFVGEEDESCDLPTFETAQRYAELERELAESKAEAERLLKKLQRVRGAVK